MTWFREIISEQNHLNINLENMALLHSLSGMICQNDLHSATSRLPPRQAL
jgi:hypothetical protein